MSRTAVIEILDRALFDEEFRRAVETDPERSLEGFHLTDEERTVLLSRDVNMMEEFFPGVLYCTIRFAMINENIVAIEPFPDDVRRSELERRASEIVATEGDRIEALKEMLTLLR
jgi:hypothetical protein